MIIYWSFNVTPPVSHDSHGITQGVVLTCGQGDVGQLGLGEDVMEKSRMAFVDIPDPVIQITAGGMHTVCLTSTGQVSWVSCNSIAILMFVFAPY